MRVPPLLPMVPTLVPVNTTLFFDSSSRRAVASLERLESRAGFEGLVLVP